jgi:hypothetical protein
MAYDLNSVHKIAMQSSIKGQKAAKKLQKQLLRTEGATIKTEFATTDSIRLQVNTIERLKMAAGRGNMSFDDIINKLLDAFYNK